MLVPCIICHTSSHIYNSVLTNNQILHQYFQFMTNSFTPI